MDHPGRVLTITRAHAIAYRTPVGGPGQSKQGSKTNFLVRLDGTGADGARLLGLGESLPRGGETGDRSSSWDFFVTCVSALEERSLQFDDRASAVAAVRAVMADLEAAALLTAELPQPRSRSLRASMRTWARQVAGRGGRLDEPRPYRGTLAGVETALLDLVARELQLSVADLLGARTLTATVAEPLSARNGNAARNLALLEETAAELTSDSFLWLDLQGGMTPDSAVELVKSVTEAVIAGRLPACVVLEQPVRNRNRHLLPALQKRADEAAQARPGADVRVIAGSGVRSSAGVQRLQERGRLGGINVRPATAGGLLAAHDLVGTAVTAQSDLMVHLSQTEGAGVVADAALRNLAVALARVDRVAVGSVAGPSDAAELDAEAAEFDAEAAEPDAGQPEAGSRDRSQLTVPTGPGLGVVMPYETIVDRITEYVAYPPLDAVDQSGPKPNVYSEVPYLQPLGPNGTKGHLLEREALALGLSTTRYSKGAFVATDGVHEPLSFKWSRSPLSSAVSLALCTHKEATRMRLRRAGVPVPRGRTFISGDYAAARAFAERIGYPVVVKPAMGVRGIGVVANIHDEHELDLAFRQLEDSKLGSQDFIVEKHVTGRDYRIVVIGDEVIAAILREPASVLGDGTRSIAELLVRKNLVRRLNPHLWGRPIKYDDAARYQLERAGMTLESVPADGQQVMLSNSCSLSQGGDSIDVLDELHPSIKEACVRAVKAVPGLSFCGVDFLLEDHTKPIEDQQAGICELNAHAAIGNCEYPLYGKPRQVARTFINECVDRYKLVAQEERAEHLALRVTIKGKVTDVGYRGWLKKRADSFGVRGWVRNVNDRTVEALLIGETDPTSALAAAAVLGPKNALPTSVSTAHVVAPDVAGFDIVDRAPQELQHVD